MRKWLRWLPVLLLMAVIFSFSGQNSKSSTVTSRGVTRQIVDVLPSTKDLGEAEKVQATLTMEHTVRKAAHFTLYALLAFCILYLLDLLPCRRWLKILLCIGLSFLYACSDELHQLFVDGRGAQWSDVFLDTFGAAVGCIVYFIIRRVFGQKA